MGKQKSGIETKSVLVPTANRRKQQKILAREARDGWRLVQIRLGGGWTKSTAWLERDAR